MSRPQECERSSWIAELLTAAVEEVPQFQLDPEVIEELFRETNWVDGNVMVRCLRVEALLPFMTTAICRSNCKSLTAKNDW